MDSISYKTKCINPGNAKRSWVLVDASGVPLGRLSSRIAYTIRGKHKTGFTPNVDCGDSVVVINANKVKLTGKKWTGKHYMSHTGYPGGQKSITPLKLKEKSPERIIFHAVKGMLPKSKLGRNLISNLFVYAGEKHDKCAQKPVEISLNI